jgi:hypothetical protein
MTKFLIPQHSALNKIGWRILLILPLLEIVWVNLHIYFFLGPLIVGVFLIENLILKQPSSKKLSVIFGLTVLATFLNPAGLKGALMPLAIFKNFGYRLAENQPVWFIEKILSNPNFLMFKIIFALLAISSVIRFIYNRSDLKWADLSFAFIFSAMAWLAIRNFALFGFFALPIIAGNIALLYPRRAETNTGLNFIALVNLTLILLMIFSGELKKVYPAFNNPRIGLEKNNSASADFFKKERLTGPIFNNYDIGGYLIFHLYPQEKVYPEQLVPSQLEGSRRVYPEQSRRVFVDNRPEAYPADFFTQTYIPMQEDKKIWDEQNSIYKFNAIIFSYRDYTPWGQTFFRRILEDPDWVTVFADSRVIILLKNNELNKDIIAKYGKSLNIRR